MTNWKEVKLESIADVIMGQSPKSEYYNAVGDGLPFLQGNRTFGLKYPIFDTYTTFPTKIAQPQDVIMSVRAPVGDLNITPVKMCLGRGVCAMRMKNGHQEFLYYLMKHNVQNLLNRESGTVFGSVNRNDIGSLGVLVPENDKIQQKVASVLSLLDAKIETNTRINNNLEQQAQALFKSWFVDFEPFGGTMPEDWKVGTFSEIIDDTIGGDWGKDEAQNNYTEEVYCIRGADIPDVKIGNKGKMPKRYILTKNYSSKKLRAGDLVIEISGGSPTQSTGRIAAISDYLLSRYDNKIICTNFCRALKPKLDYSEYIYHYWQYLYNKNVFFSYENGTTGIKNLDISGFLETEKISIPNQVVLKKFSELCDKFFKQIYFNGAENERLSALRDTLLPKLMSGKIDVSNVDISALTSTDKLSFSED